MQVFVLRQNVAHYRKLLEAETDQSTRERLKGLLREAEAQLRDSELKIASEQQDSANKPQEPCKS